MFVVPLHGRRQLAAICLRQLRRTCDALTEHGTGASAVVIADKSNLRDMRGRLDGNMLGFATVQCGNEAVSKKFNEGIQLACDPRHNPYPADYVVPCGSDDWVDWRIFTHLPDDKTMLGFQRMSFVREDGVEMTTRLIRYPGGSGIRVYPRSVMEKVGVLSDRVPYRPADEGLGRGCDTAILYSVQRAVPDLRIEHLHIDPRQIVDWKTPGANLNPYETLRRHRQESVCDPFEALKGVYPDEALAEMAAHYGRVREPVAA